MTRDNFSLTATSSPDAAADLPTLRIEYDGPDGRLRDRLQTPAGEPRTADDVDVAFRLRGENAGVLSVSDRFTGGFVCEVATDATTIKRTIEAVDAAEERYRLEIDGDGEHWRVEKRTLLVYDDDGRLLRTCSLIPGGVEL